MIRLLRDAPADVKNLTGLFVILGAFALACFGVVPLLGLPGAAILGVTLLIINPFITAAAWSHMTADVYWILSIIMTVLWPLAIVPGYWVASVLKKTFHLARTFRVVILVSIVTVWNLAIAAALLLSQ